MYTLQNSEAINHSNLHSVLFQESRVRNNYIIISTQDGNDNEHDFSKSQLRHNFDAGTREIFDDAVSSYRNFNIDNKNPENSIGSAAYLPITEELNILSWKNLKIVAEIDSIVKGKSLDPINGLRVAIDPFKTQKRKTGEKVLNSTYNILEGLFIENLRINGTLHKLRSLSFRCV